MEAARSLRSLALAETESFGNNAAGIFCEYFQMYLSRSPIPITERLKLIDELIDAGDTTSRFLAANAAASGFTPRRITDGGRNIDHFSGRPFPLEWRPRTHGELQSSREAVIVRLERILAGTDEAAATARGHLIGAPFTLAREGSLDAAVRILESLSPHTDKEHRNILDTSKRLERDAKGQLTSELLERLNHVAAQMFGGSYLARLKRWIGPRLHVDLDSTYRRVSRSKSDN